MRGRLFGGSTLAPVAIGGTQRIAIRTYGGEPLPLFEAMSTEDAVAVDGIEGREITIRGVEAGSAQLRVLDAVDGRSLLDRTTVAAAPAESAQVVPTADLVIMLAPSPRDFAFAPGEHVVAVQLGGPTGVVVDQGMRISAGTTPASVETWDSIRLTVPAEGGVDLTVDAAGTTFPARIESAGVVDDLELVDWLGEVDELERPLLAGTDLICAIPLSRSAWVIGSEPGDAASTRFVLDGVELAGEQSSVATHCATLPDAPELGAASLEVTIAGVTRTFEVQIVERDGTTTAALTSSASDGGGPVGARVRGDRAAGL